MIDREIERLYELKRYYEIVDTLAERILKDYKMDIPIKDVVPLIECFGGSVKTSYTEHRDIVKTGPDTFDIYISDWRFPKSRKFFIAARLGDILLNTNYLHDREAFLKSKTIEYLPDNTCNFQRVDLANEFAYGLLMPRDIFTDVVNKYTDDNNFVDTRKVADYFDVTVSDASGRGKRLGLFKGYF